MHPIRIRCTILGATFVQPPSPSASKYVSSSTTSASALCCVSARTHSYVQHLEAKQSVCHPPSPLRLAGVGTSTCQKPFQVDPTHGYLINFPTVRGLPTARVDRQPNPAGAKAKRHVYHVSGAVVTPCYCDKAPAAGWLNLHMRGCAPFLLLRT